MSLLELLASGFLLGEGREFAVATNRYPCVKVGGDYKPLGKAAASDDDILQMLLGLGGGPHAKALGAQPTSWRFVDVALGPLQITAARRGGVLQARVVAPQPGSAAGQPVQAPARRPVAAAPEPPAPAARPLSPPLPPPAPDGGRAAVALAAPESRRRAPAAPALEVRPRVDAHSPLEDDIQFDLVEPAKVASPPARPADQTPAAVLGVIDDDSDEIPAVLLGGRSGVGSAEASGFVQWLARAREAGASDLHIVAARPVLLRIGGDLRPVGDALPPALVEKMVMPHVPARLVDGFRREGSCDFAIEQPPHGRFRVNVSRQRTGLKASLRLIGLETPTLESLGLPAAIGNATHHHQGLIVVTGPTGHGKTSTLAAIVNLMNTETKHHIITVEDPIEYLHSRKKALISQREVGLHTRTFASALKASLREDPEVIVVGELRDTETVRMALSASETGHLVVATMNTPSAAKTIDRLIDLFPPGDQPQVRMGLAGGLRLIVSQRLVRGADGSRVFAAAEILPGNIALWNLIRDNKTYQIPSLQQRGKGLGIVRLDDSLVELVRAGKIGLDEARAAGEAPDEITAAVTGQRPTPSAKRAP